MINEKNNIQIPFSVGFINKDKKTDVVDFDSNSIGKRLVYKNRDYEYLEINPKRYLPEFNRNNNVKRIKSEGFKKLKFSFVKDIEDPFTNQIFYNPRLNFNAYEGF